MLRRADVVGAGGALLIVIGLLWLFGGAMRHAMDARVLREADLSRPDAGGGARAIAAHVLGSPTNVLEADGTGLRFVLPPTPHFELGERVTVVGHFAALVPGVRDAPRPLPRGARISRGGLDEARAALVIRATRSATFAALPVLAGAALVVVRLSLLLASGR